MATGAWICSKKMAGGNNRNRSPATLLAGHGNLADLVDGQQYKVVISAKGKAEVVCQSNDSFGKPSPKTIPISAKGSVTVSPPYYHGTASFDVLAGSLKINAKQAGCSFAYGDDDHGFCRWLPVRPRLTLSASRHGRRAT